MGESTLDRDALRLLDDPHSLADHVSRVLNKGSLRSRVFPSGVSRSAETSSVLFLLGSYCGRGRGRGEPCVVFNKRSRLVKQPGDLCFPGGRMAPRLDRYLGRILSLPGFPLGRWPYWRQWRRSRPNQARRLSLLLATGLREGLEEMRLNPLGVRMLGPLPARELLLFSRVIYPMVGWIRRQKRFFPNWEVERVVYIPLRHLLTPELYARYRLRFEPDEPGPGEAEVRELPCFVHHGRRGTETLWGATYYIVIAFLQCVFGFRPPELQALPVVDGSLGADYLGGRPQTAGSPPWEVLQSGGREG
ncbi:MAG: CoA pyrophosphatase [Deltaproteobacteria bacterium]|nr:CoA pyrophosphatase [Deltaproteobacteria bacterium]